MEKLIAIIQNIFKAKPEEITDNMSPDTIPSWDSMNYLLFISEVEKAFNIQFSVDEVMEARTLGDIKKYMKEKRVTL